ncbi:MAG: tRNA (adenosine(37)-N6)-threonylcarbamoyltransferase complex transferase subunit TsaD [Deltaproteobacteria bacterium]|nr:tRNA (adenosine(37)-N6)-threonylcarbamoyltransferase complex transferase subunit TsaD [Deltaproteobacteria bacterium]
MLVLGIDTSCDDTAAAVVKDGRIILSNVISSQDEVHQRYGGIVPELASRRHMESITPVIKAALGQAGITLDDLAGVATTYGPGLTGSLLIGLMAAKSLAYARNLPFIGVNHLEGHFSAQFLTADPPDYPYLALVVSGGHTSIFLVEAPGRFFLYGQTRDDAAGEAFDKVAKLLGLGYPGGVAIDRLAERGNPQAIRFPRSLMDGNNPDFSFSGLKTSVVRFVGSPEFKDVALEDLTASFQEAVVDVLVAKTLTAAQLTKVNRVVISGGVAANRCLRARFQDQANRCGVRLYLSPPILCTDNGAMIAAVGTVYLQAGCRHDLTMDAVSRIPTPRIPG